MDQLRTFLASPKGQALKGTLLLLTYSLRYSLPEAYILNFDAMTLKFDTYYLG